jgi:outer membrane receptor protein involved in Fe transport
MRGAYALTDTWEVGATLAVMSGRPISAFGSGNPFDETVFDSFFIFNTDTGEWELHKRGTDGRTPWIYDVGANVTYRHSFSIADLQVKLQINNLFNQQRVTEVDEFLGSVNGSGAPDDVESEFKLGTAYQTGRSALLTFKMDF